ncbi:MAG TPA: DUF2254 domain-containing protein [Actinomycetota bacterium]|nr:DUF2254 domain-containing protein [Actinomycetota bacterium]
MINIQALLERFRSSLFFKPALYVLGALVVAHGMLFADSVVNGEALPAYLRSTVDSARAMLSTIAGAIITVAAVVFSITVVSVQLASSQFSPRILRGFLRDRKNQAVLGFVMGTFTYCLLILRAVRSPGENGEEAVIPNLSVAVGLLLAVLTALAILAFIDHSARSMQVGELINRIADEAIEQIRRLPRTEGPPEPEPPEESEEGTPIPARQRGWIQQVDSGRVLASLQPGATFRQVVRTGHFVSEGTPLGFVSPAPADVDELAEALDEHFQYGPERTMQEDIEFGMRQIVDVALRALSPGVNDPTSAYEVIVHLNAMLIELFQRDLPPRVVPGEEGRRILRLNELTHPELLGRAFDQIRIIGARQPAVAIMLLRSLGVLRSEIERAELEHRLPPVDEQARLVLEVCRRADPLPEDMQRVEAAAASGGFEV